MTCAGDVLGHNRPCRDKQPHGKNTSYLFLFLILGQVSTKNVTKQSPRLANHRGVAPATTTPWSWRSMWWWCGGGGGGCLRQEAHYRSGVSQALPASDSTPLVRVVFSGNVHTNGPPALAPQSCRPTCCAPAPPWRLPGKQGAASTQAHRGSPVAPEPNSSIALLTTYNLLHRKQNGGSHYTHPASGTHLCGAPPGDHHPRPELPGR